MDAGNVPASISLTLRIDLPQNEVLHGNLWNPPYPAIPVCFELACAQQFIHGVVADSKDFASLIYGENLLILFQHLFSLLTAAATTAEGTQRWISHADFT